MAVISGLFFNCSTSPDLQWNVENSYRWAEVSLGYFGSTGFNRLSASETNINFENHISEEEIAGNRHYLNGSGIAAGDIDGDGLTDLYFARLDGPNKLYKNMGGIEFKDITSEAGVAHENYYSTGVVFADITGDGHLDLLVTAMHKENILYINDGTGNFELQKDSGLGSAKGSMTPTLADIDGDHDLDLYITNYKEINTLEHTLFINTRNSFEATSLPIEAQYSTAFYAGVADLDNDGNEDLLSKPELFWCAPRSSKAGCGARTMA